MTEPAPPNPPQTAPFSPEEMEALRTLLQRLCQRRQCQTYNALASAIDLQPPHRIHRLTLALEELIKADHAAGRPLLAALAVSRTGRGLPGPGFFQLLRELGRYEGPDQGAEAAACHSRELTALYQTSP